MMRTNTAGDAVVMAYAAGGGGGRGMNVSELQLIEVERLQIGMLVHLDLGWTEHPFPFNSFRIRSDEQIATIRSLGLARVRYCPQKSDPPVDPAIDPPAAPVAFEAPSGQDTGVESDQQRERRHARALLREQQASLDRCERQFSQASRGYRQSLQYVRAQPELARVEAEHVIDGMLAEITGEQDVAIRLLSEKAGEESSLHPLNCTVLSLLLAKACGIVDGLHEIGLGALLHDIGKIELPDRMRWRDQNFSSAERRLFQEHVGHGLALAERMGLSPSVREIIGQHHEYADGSGYPNALIGERIAQGSRIVALVNQYDNLCNPGKPAAALTPHDALAVMFARMRAQFDPATMAIFIRMMGVYPPGSAVQLTDGRYALSVAVNAARPLKPRVLVHDPAVAPEDALVIDLEQQGQPGVQRSLKPAQLPRAVFEYLSPRKRMCYFFERNRAGGDDMGQAA